MVWLLNNFKLDNTIIITVANKQYEKEAMDIQEMGSSWVHDKELIRLLKGHDWRLFGCNALTGQGIDKILEYITMKLEEPIITPWDNLPNPTHLNDVEFKQWFYEEKPFLFFDHYCLIRIIYLSIRKKNKKLSHLFEILSQSIPNENSICYSETQTLFWIQMVSFALLKSPLLEGEDNHFEDFFARCCKSLQEDCWKEYYSFKLFYSTKATKEFLPPDKKPLPNAFKSSSLALKGRHLEIDYQVL
ncbi:hypothetical protein INT47_004793 [Mucor saturninus]|uniref:Uncharacterized protein n=1 Tax=Mucor saturninus TaxID=64648 RepID=A0A8H7R1H0_9FUNG|nr:hypothetical protein INT47_004793 [Mucor saturninus]